MVPGLAAPKEKLNLKSFPTRFLIFNFFYFETFIVLSVKSLIPQAVQPGDIFVNAPDVLVEKTTAA